MPSYLVGTHVKVGTKKGVVRFVGTTNFAAGEWYGIELDGPNGKNNGSVNGEAYFVCEEKYGIFVKKAQVRLDRSVQTSAGNQTAKSTAAGRTPSTVKEAARTPVSPPADFQVGDDVKIGSKTGIIRFIGDTRFADGTWYGVELDSGVGKNNGSVNGVVYFECNEKHGEA